MLLHLLAAEDTLLAKIVAVYVNHQISPNALAWQSHCQQVCADLGIAFSAHAVDVDTSCNVEEHARNARYFVFSSHLTSRDCLVLAHHQDDQAETVLLQLFRGAGLDGMSAMLEFMPWEQANLARPLLPFSKQELLDYARSHQLKWIEDESNQSNAYTRNFVRQDVMPLLMDRWPGISNTLARAAQHCQQAKLNLDALALIDCPDLKIANKELNLDLLEHIPRERVNNVLRFWLKQNKILMPATVTFNRLMDELIGANPDANPMVSWANVIIQRYRNTIYISNNDEEIMPTSIVWHDFPNDLIYGANGLSLKASKANQGLKIPKNVKVELRFREGGEDFNWHGQTKKLKKLIQDWGIPPWLRQQIPLIYIDDVLAMVVGYAISDRFFSDKDEEAYIIELK